ncbi:hypothetical protein VCSRO2_3623 [Vibrio cholerae]|nr:hypothetical protein VCSRO2_3623 [Vibrio cholerae]
MAFVKNLIIIVLALVFSPVLILAAIYFSKEKKWFISSLFSPLSDELKTNKVDALTQCKNEEFYEKLLSILTEVNTVRHWLGFCIDWRDIDEVESQGNAIAKTHGIDEIFHANFSDEGSSVWSMLVAYDIWLQEKGYEVVLWDQGSDEYSGFICKSEVLSRFIKVGKQLGLDLVKLDHVNEQ